MTYHENLLSLVYPGSAASRDCLKPTLKTLEALLQLTPEQCHRTVLRLDGGFGTDANINWALWRGFQVLTKGYSGKRANAYARTVSSWLTLRPERRWIGWASHPPRYTRITRTAVLSWIDQHNAPQYATLVDSLGLSLERLAACYDRRGATEVEIRADKSGLALPHRRKKSLAAQEALILMTDLAHNVAAWLRPWMFQDSPFAGYGPQRIVRDVLSVPGEVIFEGERCLQFNLDTHHPYAKPLLACMKRLFEKFCTP